MFFLNKSLHHRFDLLRLSHHTDAVSVVNCPPVSLHSPHPEPGSVGGFFSSPLAQGGFVGFDALQNNIKAPLVCF